MGVIHEIVAECEKEIVFMNQVHDFVYGDERHSMINRLLRLNHRPDDERTRFNRPCIDKIVMNPPYSLGRHKEHTMAALGHLKVGGRLVAVLPGDTPVLNWLTLDNYVYAKGKSFTDEFEDTRITVSVYVFKRVK